MRISNRFRSLICGIAAAIALATLPAVSSAAVFVGVSVNIAPPVIPVYVQPPIPAPGYLWTPGYWAWGPAGYYWVPGTWVLPPDPDLLASIGTRICSSTLSTPICAAPREPPPDSTRPTRGR